jgi:hypothetical protein
MKHLFMNKKYKYMKTKLYKYVLIALCSVLSLSSCLRDDTLVDWDDMVFVIEFPYISHYITQTRVTTTQNVTFSLMLNYTIPDKKDSQSDIPVGVVVDESRVKVYNDANNASYELLPTSAYTLPAFVIPAGTQLLTVPIEINTSVLEAQKRYILPVVIKDVPPGYVISGNFGHVYLRVDRN